MCTLHSLTACYLSCPQCVDEQCDVAAPHAAARAVEWRLLQASAEAVVYRWKFWQRGLKATH